jgi:histidinol phosphatase-like PHP family hydrolase
MGVKLSLGSDAHNLADIGDLGPHLAMLEACGCTDPNEVLLVHR